jgi:hypothetical protein
MPVGAGAGAGESTFDLSYLHSRLALGVRCDLRGELAPVKDSHTRIKPLPLASGHGHGRYITVTPERPLVSVGEWPLHVYNRYQFLTVSLLRPPCWCIFPASTLGLPPCPPFPHSASMMYVHL